MINKKIEKIILEFNNVVITYSNKDKYIIYHNGEKIFKNLEDLEECFRFISVNNW